MEQLKSAIFKAIHNNLSEGSGVNLSTMTLLTIISFLGCLAPTIFLRVLHSYGLHLQALPTAENPKPSDVSRRIQAILLSTSMGATLPEFYKQVLNEVNNPDKDESISLNKSSMQAAPVGLMGSLSAIFTRSESFYSAAIMVGTAIVIGSIKLILSFFTAKKTTSPIQKAMSGLAKTHTKGIKALQSLETEQEVEPTKNAKVTTSQLRYAITVIRTLYQRLAHKPEIDTDPSADTLSKYTYVINLLLTHIIANIGQGVAASRLDPKELLKSLNTTLGQQALESVMVGFGLTSAGPRFQPLLKESAIVDQPPTIQFHLSFVEQTAFSAIYALSLPLGTWIAQAICPEKLDGDPESVNSMIDQYLTKIICGSSLHRLVELILLLASEPQRGMECATMMVAVSYFAQNQDLQTFKTVKTYSRRTVDAPSSTFTPPPANDKPETK